MPNAYDIYNIDKRKLGKYFTLVIPSCDSKIDEISYCEVLNELAYKDAPDYKTASLEELEEYIGDYYDDVLSYLDPEEVYHKLFLNIVVSDERVDSLAKRHIVAHWLKLYTGFSINEGIDLDNGVYKRVDVPEFIGPMLEKVIKSRISNMRGFTSLRALYLFEKGEALESEARSCSDDVDTYVALMQEACNLRCYADMIEEEYRKNEKGYARVYSRI